MTMLYLYIAFLFLLFKVDSAWIAYNKPKSPELANEYAGFLMALGLNGHLTKLATLNIHDYLTKVCTKGVFLFFVADPVTPTNIH